MDMKKKYGVLRFEFKTNGCEFRQNKWGSVMINDRRTKASSQYKEFCNKIKASHKFLDCWTELATKTSCVLAMQIEL